jgi:hypothetical protein
VLRRATLSDQFELQKRLWENRPAYAGQLAFITRRIGEVVARLIEESPTTGKHPPMPRVTRARRSRPAVPLRSARANHQRNHDRRRHALIGREVEK